MSALPPVLLIAVAVLSFGMPKTFLQACYGVWRVGERIVCLRVGRAVLPVHISTQVCCMSVLRSAECGASARSRSKSRCSGTSLCCPRSAYAPAYAARLNSIIKAITPDELATLGLPLLQSAHGQRRLPRPFSGDFTPGSAFCHPAAPPACRD